MVLPAGGARTRSAGTRGAGPGGEEGSAAVQIPGKHDARQGSEHEANYGRRSYAQTCATDVG